MPGWRRGWDKGGIAEARSRVEASKPRENAERDWIVVPGTHEHLVPPTLFDRAQELARSRAAGVGPKNVRAGRGLRSPYLLSGLVTCGRCGQNYQGRTVNSTKHRKDGTKIQSFYYACGGWVMKGKSACEKFLLRRDAVEEMILEVVQERLHGLLAGEGETLLRGYIEEEIATQGADPRQEMAKVKARLVEIDQKAGVLLEGLSAETKGFVDAKLRELATEKRRLQRRLEELEAAPYDPIDPDAVLREGLASIRELPRLLETGSPEDRKGFVRAFIAGITVVPEALRLDLQVRRIPAMLGARPGNGNSTCLMVAGARYTPVQKSLEPPERFVVRGVGLRPAA